ncbi:hypothetical protein [Streptomyces alanosinicus]|uniref:Uncharacterized protein n=1 Tax=Streptomyces alanosinicus TaxID=68171 RepID=A0A918YMB4_9ACTN|nr:hypothetical protein GCM10010339_54380 [Streptomyces alanosinicus]
MSAHDGRKPQKMHADDVDLDAPLVQRLIARRFPRWAALPVRRLASSGTENATTRPSARMTRSGHGGGAGRCRWR